MILGQMPFAATRVHIPLRIDQQKESMEAIEAFISFASKMMTHCGLADKNESYVGDKEGE